MQKFHCAITQETNRQHTSEKFGLSEIQVYFDPVADAFMVIKVPDLKARPAAIVEPSGALAGASRSRSTGWTPARKPKDVTIATSSS